MWMIQPSVANDGGPCDTSTALEVSESTPGALMHDLRLIELSDISTMSPIDQDTPRTFLFGSHMQGCKTTCKLGSLSSSWASMPFHVPGFRRDRSQPKPQTFRNLREGLTGLLGSTMTVYPNPCHGVGVQSGRHDHPTDPHQTVVQHHCTLMSIVAPFLIQAHISSFPVILGRRLLMREAEHFLPLG